MFKQNTKPPLLVLLLSALVACSGASYDGAVLETRGLDRASDGEEHLTRVDRVARRLNAATQGESPYLIPVLDTAIMSDFWDCRERGRQHRGIDFAGVGPQLGLGAPIVAIGRSRVTEIGRPQDDPVRFGRPLQRRETTVRDGVELPTSAVIEGYGRVFFFTENYGQWHSGAIVITELLDGPLAGHQVRYMHLGAVVPDLQIGTILEAGDELGLMGGTAILHSGPHVHVDAEDPLEVRIDLAPFLGLEARPADERFSCQ